MRSRLLVVSVLLLAPTGSADWLQDGYDASRISATPEPGPTYPDIALRVDIGMRGADMWYNVPPVIVGHHVFVPAALVLDDPYGIQPSENGVVVRIDLRTGNVTQWVMPVMPSVGGGGLWAPIAGLAAHGDDLFVAQNNGRITRMDPTDGRILRTWDVERAPVASAYAGTTWCGSLRMAVHEEHVFATCDTVQDGLSDLRAWRLNRMTLELEQEFSWRLSARERSPGWVWTPDNPNLGPLEAETGDQMYATGIAVSGGAVVISAIKLHTASYSSGFSGTDVRHFMTQGIHLGLDTDLRWAWGRASAPVFLQSDPSTSLLENVPPPSIIIGSVAWIETQLAVDRVDAASGTVLRSAPMREGHVGDRGSGLAWTGQLLLATDASTAYLLGPDFGTKAEYQLPGSNVWAYGSPIATGNGMFILRYGPPSTTFPTFVAPWGSLVALDGQSLVPIWDLPFAGACNFSVSDGLLLRWCEHGVLEVFGQSEASIDVVARASGLYPGVAEQVVVDLGASRPGAQGAPTRYRADWGDGTATAWQDEPVFTHKFATAMDVPARFFARNDAGQESSIVLTFFVGQRDPALTIFNAPFHPEYQETSFFVLGLLATGVIAVLGVFRVGRKRRTLRRELHALEAEHRRLQSDGPACEHMLAQRRARARALFLEHKLEEAHSAFLIGRIEELRHGLRLAEVEQRLDYLPHGMVKALREMLRDTRITAWERSQFLEALQRDKVLTPEQKRKVGNLIEGWFARDTRA